MTRRKVDFFFVGFPKSGTTTYYHLLKLHPEISAPTVKEINYFNTDYNREVERRLGSSYFQLAETEDDYLNFFHGVTDEIMGDFNPFYIYSEEAPLNIFRHNPASKIIVSIREPVSFLRSFHFQSLYNMIENEGDFLRALSLEEGRRTGKDIPLYCPNPLHLYYSLLVEYKKHIERFTDVFGYENVKIVLFDDVIKNESLVYQTILYFLGVKNMNYAPPRVDRNPSHALRFSRLRSLVLDPRVNKWLYTKIPPTLLPLGAKISQAIFKKKQEKPFVSQTEINRLKARYKPNVVELDVFLKNTGLLDRSLISLWGY